VATCDHPALSVVVRRSNQPRNSDSSADRQSQQLDARWFHRHPHAIRLQAQNETPVVGGESDHRSAFAVVLRGSDQAMKSHLRPRLCIRLLRHRNLKFAGLTQNLGRL
jgi:hypothetical protein